MKYVLFYLIPISVAVSLVLTIRVSTRHEPSIAGYPICPDTANSVTLDIVTRPEAKISTHPRCWSGWISFSQSNFSWSAEHGTRALEYYFQNGGREAGATGGERYALKKYPGGAFRLRGEEGISTITLVDPHSATNTGSPRGAQWNTPPKPAPLPPPPAKLEPLPQAPPPAPGAATYHALPPDQPKREPGAAAYQPLPLEPSHKESGAASFQPLPSSPSPQGR